MRQQISEREQLFKINRYAMDFFHGKLVGGSQGEKAMAYLKRQYRIMLLVFLLMLGAILDVFSAIVLVVPLILPVATQFGVHPVHLGIVFLAAMQLGYITPPVGLNLFIAGYRFNRPIVNVYLSTLPFFVFLMISVVLIAFWPSLSLYLL